MNPETSIVERLYEALVDEVSRTRPELLQESFSVAEIYQNLVPYRTHRERVGAEMNGDYEHALLRLLAGEGGYVTLESDAARERLEEELNSIHPDTGVYRNFAACEVRLQPEPLEDLGVTVDLDGPSDEETSSVDEEPSGDDAPTADGTPADDLPEESEAGEESGVGSGSGPEVASVTGSGADGGVDAELEELASSGTGDANGADRPLDDREAEVAEPSGPNGDDIDPEPGPESVSEDESPAEDASGTCLWCRENLPDREDLRFCPFCGSSVDIRPCPECGAEVESDWIFCIACGTEATD
ncbi:MAG: zinc ribbon domain-containing protein [Gemmatimonadota bacterium]